jgi:small subunit ribosomal protein S4e
MTHQKRLPAPKHYPIPRKQGRYVATLKGSRSPEMAIPSLLFLRDVTGYADNVGDAKEIVRKGMLERNGEPVRDIREGVGVLDTVSLPGAEEHYRVLKSGDGLEFVPVPDPEKHAAKIVDKRAEGEEFVYRLHTGENYRSERDHSTGNTLVFGSSVSEVEMEEGAEALAIDGSHAGEVAEVKQIQERGMNPDTAVLENGEQFETRLENLVAIDNIEVSQQ